MRHFSFHRRQAKQAEVGSSRAAGGGLIPNRRILFQEKRRQAVEAGGEVLRAIEYELSRGQRWQLATTWKRLESLFDVVELADEGLRLLGDEEPPVVTREHTVPEYLISTWFLADCQAYLCSHPENFEVLHFVSGVKIRDGQRTLDRMMRVGLSQQSTTHAVANQQDVQRALIECSERWGHALHGLFHRHPGRGALMTRPSSTDLATHERYERAYPLVGGIFESSGFVRFFGHRPFTIRLYGKGVEQRDTHLFKIQHQARYVSDGTPESEDEG
jgi:hypothetical protein